MLPSEEKTSAQEREMLAEEKRILAEEKEILKEVKKEESALKRLTKNVWVTSMLLGVIILGAVAGIVYWRVSSARISTDNALVSAPVTDLAPTVSGTLNNIFVNVGDLVPADTVVAQVGNELLKTKTASEVVTTDTKSWAPRSRPVRASSQSSIQTISAWSRISTRTRAWRTSISDSKRTSP